jgi:dienelactone hydrolase
LARYRFANFGRTAKARLSRIGRQAFGAFIAAGIAAIAPVAAQDVKLDHALNEQVVQVPVRAETDNRLDQWSLVATTFHPPGAGPFPLIVLNHGSPGSMWERQSMGRYRPLPQIREFTRRGFAVIVPMRRGYGDTGGPWAERFGACIAPHYYHAARESAKDVIAAVEFAQALPFVKADRVILVGQSAGGIASIAAASANPPGVIGVVNFSGGRGGRPYTNPGDPCVAGNMTEAIAKLARTIKVPVLWHYAENDQFFAPRHVKAWFRAFEDAGATGQLVMQPSFQWDGHAIFGAARGLPIWTAAFDRFLKDIRFALPVTATAAPTMEKAAAPLTEKLRAAPVTRDGT